MKRFPFLAALVLFVLLASCGGGNADEFPDDFVAAKSSWQAAHISDYRFTLDQTCLCPSRKGARTVTVRGGKVVSATYADGSPVEAAELGRLPSMADLFGTIEAAYARGLQVKFTANGPHGDLREVYIDYIKDASDDELRYSIHGFAIDG